MARGELRCIAATTTDEFETILAAIPATDFGVDLVVDGLPLRRLIEPEGAMLFHSGGGGVQVSGTYGFDAGGVEPPERKLEVTLTYKGQTNARVLRS